VVDGRPVEVAAHEPDRPALEDVDRGIEDHGVGTLPDRAVEIAQPLRRLCREVGTTTK
jgi:hypothetical protein